MACLGKLRFFGLEELNRAYALDGYSGQKVDAIALVDIRKTCQDLWLLACLERRQASRL
jgi:hypothetical protein